ncbi:hypothetical protein FJZ31_05455 [Candidatus Poribacteria bacterium]|nr:hypothetical protein [Candidatus Poribacteria bacterium]
MKKILCLIAIAAIVSLGCSVSKVLESSPPSTQPKAETTTPPKAETTEAPSTAAKEAAVKLPPEADSSSAFLQIENAMHRLAPSDQSGELSLVQLKKESVKQKLQGVLITNCELEHLKALVAAKKAPIVIIQTTGGSKEFRAVTVYKDKSEQVILTNPFQKETALMNYSEFDAAWKGAGTPQSALILSARSINATQLKQLLAEYLPAEKLANLTFN